jgi:predicted nucleic acid-binding protein
MRLETWSSTRKTLGRPGSPSTSRIEGTPIGPYDVLIAGQAKARKLTLVTHNTTEFQRVPGLKVEDWKGATSSPSAASRLQRSQAKPRSE